MIPLGDWPGRDLLAHRAATTPGTPAIVDADRDEEWTYAAFDRRVDAVAAELETVVSGPDDRLGALLGTRPAFAAIYFAAMRLGVTLVPLNVRETPAELEEKASRVDLDALVCESPTEGVALAVADCPIRSVDEPTHDGAGRLGTGAEGGEGGGSGNSSSGPLEGRIPFDPDRTHLLMFTSGTSGEPKAVRLTVGNVVASAIGSAFRLGVLPDDRWLCCLPMYHMGGLAPLVRSTLYGTTLVVQREFDPVETASVLERDKITGVSLVPTMCDRLLEAGWSPSDDLRFALVGGAPASRELIERCRERGVPIHPTYGATETASQVATARPADAFADPETVGHPLSSVEVSIVDDDGDPVESGVEGELVVSGPAVTPGYLSDDRTAEAFDERGFHTGDVGRRDADGRLRISGRRVDRIVTGGENVDPAEVREVLCDHRVVSEAAVVGLADDEWGERVAALVVPAADDRAAADPIDLESLLARCDERLASFKRPKTVGTADALPRTASGTVDRDAVRERLRADGTDVS
ncbi:class I adenylate-forming enzyme family protein [Natrarchaeobius oligotrophus]|uniref:2-succinylbenzoate--CoA ligase n=1 Tax=Natrarchaeobius chitinivorans TaxID=1679083 RepID=A0A3N6MM77_NATCH|nr:class I adenylate-forming enzyme family protein [Natrarchaeobius chitinivorans]RQG98490.1 2-succinylbenzoate--CoA ligase [Natrarchaeobius chitinivorans]